MVYECVKESSTTDVHIQHILMRPVYFFVYFFFLIEFAETGVEEAIKNNLLHCCLLSSLVRGDKVHAFQSV